MDQDGFVVDEQCRQFPDPCGDVVEQPRVVVGPAPCGLDELQRPAHHRWVERGPRSAVERCRQPRREQVRWCGNAVEGLQGGREALDQRTTGGDVGPAPGLVEAGAAQAFGDVPGSVRAVSVGHPPGVRDVAAGEQAHDPRLVAEGVAVPGVRGHPDDDLVTDPGPAHPAGATVETAGGREFGSGQRPRQDGVLAGFDDPLHPGAEAPGGWWCVRPGRRSPGRAGAPRPASRTRWRRCRDGEPRGDPRVDRRVGAVADRDDEVVARKWCAPSCPLGAPSNSFGNRLRSCTFAVPERKLLRRPGSMSDRSSGRRSAHRA